MTGERRSLFACAVTLLLVAGACGSADDATPTTPGAAPTSTSPAAAADPTAAAAGPTTTSASTSVGSGCALEARVAGPVPSTLDHGGLTREYVVHVPSGYDGATPAPMVFNLHAFALNIEFADGNGLAEEADPRGWFVVTPQGAGVNALAESPSGSDTEGVPFWNMPGADADASDSADDLGFLATLIDEVSASYCIDQARVYATGLSNGAGMSTVLGCRLDDRIAAIVPVAGVNLTQDCPGTTPMPILAIHGDDDAIVPYDGGGPGSLSVPDRMAQWGAHNGCEPEPVEATDDPAPGVNSTVWTGCTDGAEVILWTIPGFPHAWPRAESPQDEGRIDATFEAFEFFARH